MTDMLGCCRVQHHHGSRPAALPVDHAAILAMQTPPRTAHRRATGRRLRRVAAERCRCEAVQRRDRRPVEEYSHGAHVVLHLAEREPANRASHASARPRRLGPADGKSSSRTRPAAFHPLAGRRTAQSPGLRPLAGRPAFAADRPRGRESRLAGDLRHRAGRDVGRLRHACRRAGISRTARLAGRRLHGARLEPEASDPDDRHQRDLPADRRRRRRSLLERDPRNRCSPAARGSAPTPKSCATSRSASRG